MESSDILLAVKPVTAAFEPLSVPQKGPYCESAFECRLQDRLVEEDPDSVVFFSSPEDVILSKLRWYEAAGRVSERQWLDVLGVIKVQADSLDRNYLIRWASAFGLRDLLQQAFSESGMTL